MMIKKLYKNSNFYISSSIYSILSIIAAAAGYAIYPLTIRLLPVMAFGEFATTIALAGLLSCIFLALNVASLFLTKKHPDNLAMIEYLQQKIMILFVITVLLLAFFSPIIMHILKLSNYLSLLALSLLMIMNIPTVFSLGYLQGKKEMSRIGVYILSASVFKLLFTILLAVWLRSEIAIFGVVLGQICGLIVLHKLPGSRPPSLLSIFKRKSVQPKNNWLLGYLIKVVVSCICLSFAQSADILYGKSLLSNKVSGTFVAISTLSNFAFYISSLLIWITLSGINPKKPAHNRRMLYRSTGVIFVFGVIFVAGLNVFQSTILKLFVGDTFGLFIGQLPKDSLYQTVVATVTLYIFWLMAQNKKFYLLSAIVFVLPLLILPIIFTGNDPITLINLLLQVQFVGIISVVLLILVRYLSKKSIANVKK